MHILKKQTIRFSPFSIGEASHDFISLFFLMTLVGILPPPALSMKKYLSMLQISLEMESKESVETAIEYFKKVAIGLKTRCVGERLELKNDDICMYKLPKRYSRLEDAALYTYNNCTPSFDKACGSIAYNDRQVILNLWHYYSDGGFIRYLLQHFGEMDIDVPNKRNDGFEFMQMYADKAPDNVVAPNFDNNLTRIKTNDRENLSYELVDDQYITKYWKTNEIKNYDQKIRAPKRFTETIYMANYFAACAHENRLLDTFGMNTVIDLRKWLKRPINFGDCAHMSNVSPFCNVRANMKICDFADLMRKSLDEKLSHYEHFGLFKSPQHNQEISPLQGSFFEISNMGPMPIKKPIQNLWISMGMKGYDRNTISNMSFSVNDGENNNVVTRFRWNPLLLSPYEARRMANCVNHFIQNISYDRYVDNVFDEIKEVYKL